MNDERQEFSKRLAGALQKAGYEPRPGVLHKLFNSRYRGVSVTFQSVSRWLGGKSIPEPDKLRVLAALVGMEPHELQFGGKPRVGEAVPAWESLSAPDRATMDAYLGLPAPQRKLVRELVAMLAAGVRS
ncbi:MAG: hypothetical protein J0L59_03065 [Xanthomonadales bacterium]|nr:hypothetical protein [Xanthomonadales bacterium]